MNTQGLLFSEPSIAETGVWCKLNEGIDPAQWAGLCRHIGQMEVEDFNYLRMALICEPETKPSLWERLTSAFKTRNRDCTQMPLISFGPGKPGEAGQWEK